MIFNIAGLLISVIGFLLIYVLIEIDHYRLGHDVYDWVKTLVKWIDRK